MSSYIGQQPISGSYSKLDSISGSFNGVTTTFNLTVSGQSIVAGSANNLIISLNGVVQEPGVSFTVNSNQITFDVAPATGTTFFGIRLGHVYGIGIPSAGTVVPSSLTAGTYSIDISGNAGTVTNGVYTTGAQTITGVKRGAITTDNDLSFDLNAAHNFQCTTAGNGTLTFTNIASAAGQSGFIELINASNHVISKAATTRVDANFLSIVSSTGTYLISYFCDGTNVFCATTGATS